ncbi:MAG: DUF6338 family protein [Candidatus Thermoplasmatota archaeon]
MAASDILPPSVGDLIPALALIAPGFLVLYLVANFRGRRLSENPLFVTLASLLTSGFLGLFFLAWNNLTNGVEIVQFILDHPIRTALEFLALVIAASLLAALLEDLNPVRYAFHRIRKKLTGQTVQSLSVWDAYLGENLDNPVIVESKDGRLIGGFLRRRSQQDDGEPDAIVLVKPALVERDAQGNLSGVSLGRSILLQAEDVRTVTVIDGSRVDGSEQPATKNGSS